MQQPASKRGRSGRKRKSSAKTSSKRRKSGVPRVLPMTLQICADARCWLAMVVAVVRLTGWSLSRCFARMPDNAGANVCQD